MQSFRETLKYIGDFQARLLLTVFYFILMLPFGLLGRWGIDPLGLRRSQPATSAWQNRRPHDTDLASARRQTWV